MADSPYLTEAERERYPALLTAKQAMELLQMHRNTFYELLAQGRIPGASRVGRSWRVARDVLLRHIAGEDSANAQEDNNHGRQEAQRSMAHRRQGKARRRAR